MPNLLIKTLFICTALCKQIKATFRIIISFIPLRENTSYRQFVLKKSHYEKYVLSFIPQIKSSVKFLVKYKYIVQPLSLGVLVFAFSPQKAMAMEWPPKNPQDISKMIDMFCNFCDSFGDLLGSSGKLHSTQTFIDKYRGSYCTQTLTKNAGVLLSYGRQCCFLLPIQYRIAYLSVETTIHAMAISSQISLSCSMLGIKVDDDKLTQAIFKTTLNNALKNFNWSASSQGGSTPNAGASNT